MFNICRDFWVPYVTFIAQIHWMYNIQVVGCFFRTDFSDLKFWKRIGNRSTSCFLTYYNYSTTIESIWIHELKLAGTHTHFCFVLCFLFLSFLSFFMRLYPFFSLFYSLYISFYLSSCFLYISVRDLLKYRQAISEQWLNCRGTIHWNVFYRLDKD